MAGHVVTGPLAILKDENGLLRYYYKDAELPDDLPKDEVQRLVDTGLVEPVKKPAARSGDSKS